MRVCLYHRVSTLDQHPELARRELEQWVERQGGIVARCVEETASGAFNGRPGLQQVLELARAGDIDAVAVWKLDRLGRSALDLLANIRTLSDCGVRVVAITQGIDVKADGDAMSKLLVTMLAAIAEFERDLIKERTMLGLDRARRRGVRLGRPKARGPLAEDVVAARKAGKSWSTIAEEFGTTASIARDRAVEGGYVPQESPRARALRLKREASAAGDR